MFKCGVKVPLYHATVYPGNTGYFKNHGKPGARRYFEGVYLYCESKILA